MATAALAERQLSGVVPSGAETFNFVAPDQVIGTGVTDLNGANLGSFLLNRVGAITAPAISEVPANNNAEVLTLTGDYRVEQFAEGTSDVLFYSKQTGEEPREYYNAAGQRLYGWPYSDYRIEHATPSVPVELYSKNHYVEGRQYYHVQGGEVKVTDLDSQGKVTAYSRDCGNGVREHIVIGKTTTRIDETANTLSTTYHQPVGDVTIVEQYRGVNGYRGPACCAPSIGSIAVVPETVN